MFHMVTVAFLHSNKISVATYWLHCLILHIHILTVDLSVSIETHVLGIHPTKLPEADKMTNCWLTIQPLTLIYIFPYI